MNILQRLFKISQAEAHAAVNQLEDPIKLTEQGIRDMREELEKAMLGLGEVKAMAIRARNESENYRAKAQDYESKAVQLLQRAHSGDLNAAEADRLAGEALARQEENQGLSAKALAEQESFENNRAQMEQNVKSLKSTISHWENELRVLQARATVSKATKTINKQMALIDASGTVALLERMKHKVAVEESLAESYGEMAHQTPSLDERIDQALAPDPRQKAARDVAALKARLGLGPEAEGQEKKD